MSSATMEGTTFESGGGFDLCFQECIGVRAPLDDTEEAFHNGCVGEPGVVDPRVEAVSS